MDKKILKNLQLPSNIALETSEEDRFSSRFIMRPLEKGYAVTLGNSLRRVLYSSLHGYAISSFKLTYHNEDGKKNFVKSEFDNVPSVMEDTLDIITNFKHVRLLIGTEKETKRYSFEFEGPCSVTAKDLDSGDLEIINPDLHLFTISSKSKIWLDIIVEWGKGFITAEKRTDAIDEIGVIPIDTIFSPVKHANFHIDSARVENITDYESLILEVTTDGTMTPKEAVEQASYILIKYFAKFLSTMVEENDLIESEVSGNQDINDTDMKLLQYLDQSLDTLEFTERIKNCFNSANIKTFRELLSMSESQINNLKNFGQKSLDIVKAKLTELGLNLGMKDEIERLDASYKK